MTPNEAICKRMETDPIMRVEWKPAELLTANGWNPNYVMDDELRLIETSILRNGWVQPILIRPNDEIVDGFHRWRLAQDSKLIKAKYSGFVPCVVLDISEAEAMMLTVRINRAKGKHAALRMSDLVRKLLEMGRDKEEIARGIGATLDEVETLSHEDVFAMKHTRDYRYSQSWAPNCRLEKGKVNS